MENSYDQGKTKFYGQTEYELNCIDHSLSYSSSVSPIKNGNYRVSEIFVSKSWGGEISSSYFVNFADSLSHIAHPGNNFPHGKCFPYGKYEYFPCGKYFPLGNGQKIFKIDNLWLKRFAQCGNNLRILLLRYLKSPWKIGEISLVKKNFIWSKKSYGYTKNVQENLDFHAHSSATTDGMDLLLLSFTSFYQGDSYAFYQI